MGLRKAIKGGREREERTREVRRERELDLSLTEVEKRDDSEAAASFTPVEGTGRQVQEDQDQPPAFNHVFQAFSSGRLGPRPLRGVSSLCSKDLAWERWPMGCHVC